MTDQLPEFHLGIVGGCMSHQAGIPFNALYHRQLTARAEAQAGMRLRTHIARAFGDEYEDRLHSLLAKGPLDGVLLHLRVTVTGRARLTYARVEDGRIHRWLHPALFSRRHEGAVIEAMRLATTAPGADPWPTDPAAVERALSFHDRRPPGRRRRDLNFALAATVGLDRWAVTDEMLRLRQFVSSCAALKVPLFVLGPTPTRSGYWQDRVPRMLAQRIRQFARRERIPHAVLDPAADGEHVLKPDGRHLSLQGHGYIADQLVRQGLFEWMAAVKHSPAM